MTLSLGAPLFVKQKSKGSWGLKTDGDITPKQF